MDDAAAHHQSARSHLLRVVALAYAAGLAGGALTAWGLRGWGPFWAGAAGDIVATAVVFAFSVACDNSSLYDPYWSVAPLPLVVFWSWGNVHDVRQIVVVTLVFVWGIRLTYNCLARWRRLDQEDFRYVDIRHKTGRFYWPASLVSLHLMPTAWVFGGLIPLYPILASATRPWGVLDAVALGVTGAAIALETVADRQLRRFLLTRHSSDQVLDSGLWAVSRHPNYFGEVLFWWGLYLFGLAASPLWPWAILGPLAITFLFVFISIPLMDKRMLARHPAWAAQTKGRSALIPWSR